MKCPFCGANLSLEDEKCPYCGTPNPEGCRHQENLHHYQAEFEKTKQDVYTTSKRFAHLSVKTTIIAILILLNIAAIILNSRSWDIYRAVTVSYTHLDVYKRQIAGIVVSKDGKVNYEKYFNNCTPQSRIHVYSVTKSILSLLIGIAMDKGYIKDVNQKILDFFPEYNVTKNEAVIQNITLKNLLTMTAPYKYRDNVPYTEYFTSSDWVKSVSYTHLYPFVITFSCRSPSFTSHCNVLHSMKIRR